MKEHVIKHESADGQYRPFLASSCPELFWRLTFPEGLR